MKSLIASINNLVLAINNLTSSLNKKNSTYSSTTTSNPYSSNVKITSYYEPKSSTVNIPRQEYEALQSIYNALTDKGSHPKHHDHVRREIELKWPTLSKALSQLVTAHNQYHNPPTKKNQIWKEAK